MCLPVTACDRAPARADELEGPKEQDAALGALRSSCTPSAHVPRSPTPLAPGPGHLLCCSRMATHHTLWMGLVLLGLLGGLQAVPEAQVSVQPDFQPDKVRGFPEPSPRATGPCQGKGTFRLGLLPGRSEGSPAVPGSAGQGLNGRAGRRLGSCPRRLTPRGPPWAPRPVSHDGPRRHRATHAPMPSKHGHSYGHATPRGHTSAHSTPGYQNTGGWGTGMAPKTAVRGGGSGDAHRTASQRRALSTGSCAGTRQSAGPQPRAPPGRRGDSQRSAERAEDLPRPPSGMRRPRPPAVSAGRSARAQKRDRGRRGRSWLVGGV
ncbi:collagen alpha-1(III) chain-like isoform X2 [Piliocolobus tephrosceles]|nr:collagen alpha-1(III) chain-like isoform X2 [Piliocolobus tephrosceles]